MPVYRLQELTCIAGYISQQSNAYDDVAMGREREICPREWQVTIYGYGSQLNTPIIGRLQSRVKVVAILCF